MAYADIEDRRAASKRNYYENKEIYIEKAAARKDRLYAEVIVPAKNKSCVDCHQSFPPVCMDFDHGKNEKKFEISSSFDRVPMVELLEEIAKCEVVCANCHRLRTAQRISKADSSNRQDGTLRTCRSECNSLVGFQVCALLAELADAPDSKPGGRNVVPVRLRGGAPRLSWR